MKTSFSSVFVLAALFHLPCLVLGAPFTWQNRHAYYARSVEANSTTTAASEIQTTTLEKGKEATATAFVNSTSLAEDTATATQTQEESTASATIIKGSSPLQTALLPKITDWNSCQGFLSNSGINLFVNQINLNFDVVINQVNVFEILIDNRGRARETRIRHAFPQPTNYYPEFDQSQNKGGNKSGKGKGKGNATVTATATAVIANKAEQTVSVGDTNTSTVSEAGTATDTVIVPKGKETTIGDSSSSVVAETLSSEATVTESAASQATAVN